MEIFADMKCASCGEGWLYQSGKGHWPTRQAGDERRVELLVPFYCVECQAETSVVFRSIDKGCYDKMTIQIELTDGRAATV